MGERLESMTGPVTAGRNRRRWHFAGAILDEMTLELTVAGIPAELERKPLEVLTYLLQHAGEVCTKDELLAGVWPGRVLSETVLTKCVGKLRDVLGDGEQEIIKTAYGFGYRLVVPVRVETAPLPEVARLDFKPGDHPAGRPLWKLVERLGVGGHGEVWRCRHEKTREQRVFKFALDEDSLGALKREITLFRVINDTLGDGARVLKLLDWNLEQFPYFVEAEFVAGGNLVDWIRGRGGANALPMPERLEIVAKIASALAAVHSVGVLHKDLKPSNVLVRASGESEIEVLLADFGSGAVLDIAELERLGITRLGFTKTLAASSLTSGTPLYLAPEILHGQPFTVKSDLYALGMILYQLVSGDFHKVMSPGWERDVEDELVREDIALLAEGNPAMRLADADALARRLREIEQRRTELATRREAEVRAERAKRLLERARARRFGIVLAFAAMATGLAVSTAMYFRAREAQLRSEAAADKSRAVVEFLSNDVFNPVSSGKESVKDLSVTQFVSRAAGEIDKRFEQQPDVASQLHFVLGRSFFALYDSPRAVTHFRRSMQLGVHLEGEGSEPAVRSAAELVLIDYVLGKLHANVGRYREVLAAGEQRLGPTALSVLDLRLRLTRGDYLLGNWEAAAESAEKLLADLQTAPQANDAFVGELRYYYGQILTDLGRPREAQVQLKSAIEEITRELGESHGLVAESRSALGRAYAESGNFAEADAELSRAAKLASAWALAESWTEIRPRFFRGLLLLEQDQPAKAEPFLKAIVEYEDAHTAAYLAAHAGAEPELDHTAAVRHALGETYARQGKLAEAVATLTRAIAVGERASGAEHPVVIGARLTLAECLIESGRVSDAVRFVDSKVDRALAKLPASHPLAARAERVTGLLALARGDRAAARKALGRAFDLYKVLYSSSHWRTVRASQELSKATES